MFNQENKAMKNTKKMSSVKQERLDEKNQIEYFIKQYQELKVLKKPSKIDVVGSPVTALHFEAQINLILEWAMSKISKFVCVANTHMLVEAHWNPEFSSLLKDADLITPDGMPLVWMLKLMGFRNQNRVAGMDILLSLCKLAPLRKISIFFLGSETTTLEKMKNKLTYEFPNLQIAGMEPLPFRPLTHAEDEAIVQRIHDSGAAIVLVALGCPKQEYWMSQHKDKIKAVMIGLGGAFPVFAGDKKRAPYLIRDLGCEWLYRFRQEPARLLRRYGTTIPTFIWLASKQLLKLLYYNVKRNFGLGSDYTRLE